jgi:hypothetical protein
VVEKEAILGEMHQAALFDIGRERKILWRFILASPLILKLLCRLPVA